MQTAAAVRQLLRERDPRLAVFSLGTTADLVSGAVATRRILLWIVVGFAAIGVVIALIGLYGTVAYMVTQRTRELGVRLALGATASEIRRLVLQRGLVLVAGGMALGAGGTFALRQAIASQLFGITAMSVQAIALAAVGFLLAATLACLVPAVRATRINPVTALRAE
jgi:putative ABC transport system permease protein